MKRRRLDNIVVTIGLTIVVAMGLGLTLQRLANAGLGLVGFPQWKNPLYYETRFYMVLVPAKVTGLVELLDAIPANDQAAVITAAGRPQIRIEVLGSPLPGLVNSTDGFAPALRNRIELLFTAPHSVIVAPRGQQNTGLLGGAGPKQVGMRVEVPLKNGHWLLFTTSVPTSPADPVTTEYSRAGFAAWLALATALVLLLSFLAARRLANPLSELALATEHLGASGEAPLLMPKGPRELRITISAFNRMQERMRRFGEDRVQMLAAISHDLRTSLTRVKLRLEIGETPEQKQRMIAELDAMSAMIGSILSFARDDTKREPRALLDLDALVEGICEDASDAGGAVIYRGCRGVPISGRPVALRRAISNLVDNAVKYGGGAEVTLTAEAGRIVVAVEDRGPGIPRSERENVFEPFYRIDGSRNPETGGVGLGLAVARSIAREHGGDIVLATRKGGGLSARLELPA
ncbi:MAG TPA: ATP-binding protein [Stellaceae bacterium]|jgi:signal transduction histidine kinase